jgi:hypothetical protein
MKEYSIKLLLLCILFSLSDTILGQSFEHRLMDVKSMQEDLTFIQNKLNEIHPEPYHFISQSDFGQRVENLKNNLNPMTKEDWYVKLANLIATLHDGHTVLIYPYEYRQKYFDQGGKIFPFHINLEDDQQVVIRHQYLQDERLNGAVLVEINQKPINEVIDKMRSLTFGESEVFRNSQISGRFGRMYWLLYGHTDSVVLKTRLANGEIYEKSAACLLSAEYDSISKILFPITTAPNYTHMHYTHLNDRKVGLLTLYDFSTYKGYKDSIRNIFKQVREHAIDTLFLDLRDNGGGEHSITEEINNYLLKEPWVLVSKAKIKMSDEFYGVFPKSVRWLARILPKKPSLKLAAATMTKNTKIEKTIVTKDPVTRQRLFEIHTRPRQHYSKTYLYSGKLFLLTNRNSYSMSGMYAAIMKDYKRASIIGEETGGLANPHGSNVALKLPHSKFTFTVSTSRAYRPSGIFDNRGVMPDIPIPYKTLMRAKSIEDMVKLITDVK